MRHAHAGRGERLQHADGHRVRRHHKRVGQCVGGVLCEHALGERTAVVHGERAAGVDQCVVVQMQTPAPVGERKRADVLGLVVQAHDCADAADEADTRVAGVLQCVKGVEHGLA